MANPIPSIEQRLTPPSERARLLVDSLLQSLRVAVPAVVTGFQPGPPATVSVQVAINEYVQRNAGGNLISLESTPIALPELHDVPVHIPGAGGWNLTFPIQAGDECLVLFADAALDVWLQNGGTDNNPISQRRHSLSDGIAIFGLRSKPRGLSGYSTSSTQLRNDGGDVKIDLAGNTITVTAPNVTVNSQTVSVSATNATVACSDTATVKGGSHVMLGNDGKMRDFLTHVHADPQGGNTGPVL